MLNFLHNNDAKLQELLVKILRDPALKAKLLSQPNQTMDEFGIDVPDDVKICVHQNTATLFHLALPEKPASDDVLNVSAGVMCVGFCACNFDR